MWWADNRVLTLLNSTRGARRQQVVRLFSHVLAGEHIWLLRLRGEDPAHQEVWPDWTLGELNAVLAANMQGYHQLLMGLAEDELMAEIAYTNSQGIRFRTRIADVLAHVALHGSYHRGQIAMAVRSEGAEPVNTDFITFVREAPAPVATMAIDRPSEQRPISIAG